MTETTTTALPCMPSQVLAEACRLLTARGWQCKRFEVDSRLTTYEALSMACGLLLGRQDTQMITTCVLEVLRRVNPDEPITTSVFDRLSQWEASNISQDDVLETLRLAQSHAADRAYCLSVAASHQPRISFLLGTLITEPPTLAFADYIRLTYYTAMKSLPYTTSGPEYEAALQAILESADRVMLELKPTPAELKDFNWMRRALVIAASRI